MRNRGISKFSAQKMTLQKLSKFDKVCTILQLSDKKQTIKRLNSDFSSVVFEPKIC